MKTSNKTLIIKWLYADLIVGANTSIILMERKKFNDNNLTVSPRSLRAGRAVINAIFEFGDLDSVTSEFKFLQ